MAALEGPRVSRGAQVPASPAVSIMVLVTQDTEAVQRCLTSIAGVAAGGPVAEVIVVANGTPPAR